MFGFIKPVPTDPELIGILYSRINRFVHDIGKFRQNFFPLARAEKRGKKVKKGGKLESKKSLGSHPKKFKFSSHIALARFRPLNPTVPDHSSVRCGMSSGGISTTSVAW
jgi:hypothetical protein